MVRLLLILGLLISGCSHNQPKPTAPTPVFNPYARVLICVDEYNKPIKILPSYEAKRVSQLAFAQYNIKKQRREIGISVTLINQVPSSIVEFTAYHECGHHQLNHVDTSDKPQKVYLWSGKMIRTENAADCFAANAYYENNGHIAFSNLIYTLHKTHFLSKKRIKKIQSCIK